MAMPGPGVEHSGDVGVVDPGPNEGGRDGVLDHYGGASLALPSTVM